MGFVVLSAESREAGSRLGSFRWIILWPGDAGRGSTALAISVPGPPWSLSEHLPPALMSISTHRCGQDGISWSSAPGGSLRRDPLPLPLHLKFHRDPLGARVMPLPSSPITPVCQPQGHGQQGVTQCSSWFDGLAFLGPALHPSPLWLCTGLMGCVMSNDVSLMSPRLLGAGVWLVTLKCCVP